MTCTNPNPSSGSSLTTRCLLLQAYTWLALPTLIWLAGWLRIYISIPVIIITLYTLLRIIGFNKRHNTLSTSDLNCVKCNRKYWINILLIAIAVAISGVGGIFFQEGGDPAYRNAVFYELVENSWPVKYPGETTSMLCYFTGFWLPAALVAKATGSILIGDLAQYLYALWGMTIIFNFLYARYGGEAKYRILIFFLLYCGWDIAICAIFDGINNSHDFIYNQKDISSYYYASNAPYTLFKYNFNQGYASFIALLLLYYTRKDIATLIFTYSLMFISAPFPAAGILPLVAIYCLKHFRHSATWQNCVGILIFLLESAYYLSNNNGANPQNGSDYDEINILFAGVVFIICSYIIYLPWIWRRVRKDITFWVLGITMLSAPYISLGGSPDFGYRLGIPFAFYFMMQVMDRVLTIRNWRAPANAALLIALAVGSLAPLTSYRCTQLTAVEKSRQDESITRKKWDPRTYIFSNKADYMMGKLHSEENRYYNNFIADSESFFTKYLMK